MIIKRIIISFLLFSLLISCSKDGNDPDDIKCGPEVIIDNKLYNNTNPDAFGISEMQISDDCIYFTIESGGCDGSTWEVKLIDADEIMESAPPQRNLKISFKNDELCDAVIQKEFAFDLKKLRVSGDAVILNIKNTGQSIKYNY